MQRESLYGTPNAPPGGTIVGAPREEEICSTSTCTKDGKHVCGFADVTWGIHFGGYVERLDSFPSSADLENLSYV